MTLKSATIPSLNRTAKPGTSAAPKSGASASTPKPEAKPEAGGIAKGVPTDTQNGESLGNGKVEIVPVVAQIGAPRVVNGFKISTGKQFANPTRAARELKYPFAALEIGQSFFVPGAKLSSMSSVSSAAGTKLTKRNGGKRFAFIARKDEEDGKEGVSVIRVEPKEESPPLPAPVGDKAAA